MAAIQGDPFLKPGTAVNTISSSNNWATILANEGLSVTETTDANVTDVGGSKLANVSLASGSIPGVVYASELNYDYFLETYPESIAGQQWNAAWAGDSGGSGVLLLRAPVNPATGPTLRAVLQTFKVDLSSGSKIAHLVNAIDTSNALTIVVSAPKAAVSDAAPTSGLWCVVDVDTYQITQRVAFDFQSSIIQSLVSWIEKELTITVNPSALAQAKPQVIATTSTGYQINAQRGLGQQTSTPQISFTFTMGQFQLYLDLTAQTLSVTLTPTTGMSVISMVTSAFASAPDAPTSSMPDDTQTNDPFVAFFGNSFYPWYLQLSRDTDNRTASIDWAVGVLIVKQTTGGPLIIGLTYDSASKTFFGQLITHDYLYNPVNLRSPLYDARYNVMNTIILALGTHDLSAIKDGIDLWALVSPQSIPPKEIPHFLTDCEVSLTKFGDGTTEQPKTSMFSFAAALSLDGDERYGSSVPTGFSWTTASVNVVLQSVANQDTLYSINVSSSFEFKATSGGEAATALITVLYNNFSGPSTWLLTSSINDLSVGLLSDFFDPTVRGGAMAILDKLTLRSLNIVYAYSSGVASSFFMFGVLLLGELELDLLFQYVGTESKDKEATAYDTVMGSKDGKGSLPPAAQGSSNIPENSASKRLPSGTKYFLFEAKLRTTSTASTIGSVLESIVPGSSTALPQFVSGIPIDPTGSGHDLADLVFKHDSETGSTLCVSVNIAGFEFDFVQFKTIASPDNKTPASIKRLLRFTCDKIPMMNDVPLIKQLPQPFDSFQYLWVSDDQTVLAKQGITKADLANLPSPPVPPIQYKKAKKDDDNPEDVVLAVGHHFVVIVSGKVVLDHVFGSAAAAPPMPTEVDLTSTNVVTNSSEVAPSTEGNPTKGDVQLKAGPLSVSAISFQVKTGHLLISLDASLNLGAISMSVVGFTIDVDLNKIKLNDLSSLTAAAVGDTIEKVHISLHGLAVGLERGPITLNGVFEHEGDAAVEVYRGGVAVGFKSWQILAVGEYKIIKQPTAYRAVFVYGKLDGPLVELEFATISGVRLGFGYNYMIRMPTVNELYSFPFISDTGLSGAGNDPMVVLNAITAGPSPFVSASEGSMWFCAGMTITAFDLVTLTAVLMLEITTSADSTSTAAASEGVVMALLADGIFQMEPLAPPEATLFYIEIVLKVELNFAQGYIAADAALAPASHVYVPQAHLTGAASFYSWFGSNPYAGDWVVSVGGYARSYTPPPHYPVPDRIQLSFVVGDNIQIIGTGYVAVTPRCAMAGGTLHLSLGVGPVSAYADVVMDAFINFKPFHFHASISLSVGIECEIDILFIHIHVSVHVGADLVLWGPNEFGGTAHVDFWFFGFDIAFGGGETQATDPVSLIDFLGLLQTGGPQSAPRSTDAISGSPNDDNIALHKWTVEAGLIPAEAPAAAADNSFPNTGTTYVWDVDPASLVMRVDVNFALTEARFATSLDGSSSDLIAVVDKTVSGVYAMPMHSQQPADSVLTITIAKDNIIQKDWRAELVFKPGPPALWSHTAWTSADDPLWAAVSGGPQPAAVRDGNLPASLALALGVRLYAPEPMRARSKIVRFDVSSANVAVLHATKDVALEVDDLALAAALFEPTETRLETRWIDFGNALAAVQNDTRLNLAQIRGALASQISDTLEWDIRPVGASVDDPDALDAQWILLGLSPARLAADLGRQWPELPFVAVTA
ncbi:hypothetical protein BAUCODRAFT_28742 [Baudoinia panamericana UAMH 10762]|uniref:DUF6603 domain-containing protein n=1 Tax=Baudoinia panamericana (strain UAMH 10762) TaxID=717646 RepID=M2NLM1_BAUPA|nr:uncharacterized protein BAUCODRAFT_28742 [Baudoinia panamericana UAMH 10762]EMD00390.1 hypothetical protein BAUCODRAFT_28742 [Baudoinia panamericana UAMH 10762]